LAILIVQNGTAKSLLSILKIFLGNVYVFEDELDENYTDFLAKVRFGTNLSKKFWNRPDTVLDPQH
jgi:hypothetical protein